MLAKKCKCCNETIYENEPKYLNSPNEWFCGECALLNGFIEKEEYLKTFLYFIGIDCWVEIKDGKVIVGVGSKNNSTRNRNNPKYQKWRTEVFVRDNFTCQICNKVGGKLNAHHIKPYSKFVDNRLDVDNGITLCIDCHKRVHKTKDKKYIKGV